MNPFYSNINSAFSQRATPSGQHTPQRMFTPVPNRRQEIQNAKDELRMLELQRNIRQMEAQEAYAHPIDTSFNPIQNQALQIEVPSGIQQLPPKTQKPLSNEF